MGAPPDGELQSRLCSSAPDETRNHKGAGITFRLRIALTIAVAITLAALALVFLRYGGYLVVAIDPLPEHADVAVVLGGKFTEQQARSDRAVAFLGDGRVDHVVVSVIRNSGSAASFHTHFQTKYGSGVDRSIVFCEIPRVGRLLKNVSSSLSTATTEEALAIQQCLVDRNWRSVIVVTSNYHTRRAGLIWRFISAMQKSIITVSVQGVSDGYFERYGWWRRWRYVKTWMVESLKLVWWYTLIQPFERFVRV